MPGIPMTAPAIGAVASFDVSGTPLQTPLKTYRIAGQTQTQAGVIVPNCVLVVLRTTDNSVAALGVSDASGNYGFDASVALQHRVDAVDPVTGFVGSTANTLVGS